MIRVIPWLLVSASAYLTACATNDEALYPGYREGWRRAQVLEVGDETLVARSKKYECHAESSQQDKSKRFAVASYSFGGDPNLRAKRIVAIPDQVNLSVGNQVFVNVVDCHLSAKAITTGAN